MGYFNAEHLSLGSENKNHTRYDSFRATNTATNSGLGRPGSNRDRFCIISTNVV